MSHLAGTYVKSLLTNSMAKLPFVTKTTPWKLLTYRKWSGHLLENYMCIDSNRGEEALLCHCNVSNKFCSQHL